MNLATLMKTNKTVFRYKTIEMLFSDMSPKTLHQSLRRAKKAEKLLNPQRNIRTLPVYNMNELA